MRFIPPPESLRDVSVLVDTHGADYTNMVKEFIDHLIRDLTAKGARKRDSLLSINPAVFRDEPTHLPKLVQRVHLAGLAEHMANLSGQPAPAWCQRQEFFLAEPLYMCGPAARERTLAETPAAFRRRLFFCVRVLVKLFAFLPD